MNHKIKIIGLGGIGSILSEMVSRYLNYYIKDDLCDITLIDGDSYESKNNERQVFSTIGNKAQIKINDLASKFKSINYNVYPHYINNETVDVIEENDMVFICVDNHKSRKIINDKAKALNNITIISGGNEYTDGNVQLFIRNNGQNLTPTLTDYHPEIENANDKLPDEMSCEELSKSEPQLLFTNLMAATLMCCMFYNILNENISMSEVFFDIKTMKTLGKSRKLI